MRVTLTGLKDPDRLIVAIKDLRQASLHDSGRGPGFPKEGMGLAEARDAVYALRDGQPVAPVDVYDTKSLADSFTFTTAHVTRDDVLEFVLDVLSMTDPETSRAILALPSYSQIKRVLRAGSED